MARKSKQQLACPQGWKSSTLGSLFEFKNGLNKEKAAFGKGTPIVNYTDVFKHPLLEEKKIKGLVTVNPSEKERFSVKKGDVFFTRTSETLPEIGLSAVLLDDMDGAVFSGYVLRARQKSTELLPQYCGYSLRAPSVRKEIMRKSSMTTRALTSGTNLSHVSFCYPQYAEQKRIVKVLEVWDRAIALMERKIALKREVKKGLMQQLLTGKRRLPGFSGEWETAVLDEVVTITKGKNLSKAELSKHGKNKCVHYGELFTKYNEVITSVISKTDKDEKVYKSKSGDVLMPTSDVTPRGLATASCINEENVIIGGDTLVIKPKKHIDGNFLSFYINSHRKDVMRLVSGTTVFHLYGSDMKKFKISYPANINEQEQIVKIMINTNAQIYLLEEELSLLKDQKKYLLNNLVTGAIRTPEDL